MLVLWLVLTAVVTVVLTIPQPVDPWEFPSLTLSRRAVAEDVRRNGELAERAPGSDQVRRLRSLFVDHGMAEVNPPYEKVDYESRQVEIFRTIRSIEQTHGEEAIAAIRALAVEDFMSCFRHGRLEPKTDEQIGAVGGFEQMLDKYGVVFREVLIAPELTVRAMFKARWNLIHRKAVTDGFSEIELQAYWGWLALHGWGVPLQERIDALSLYRDAGGAHAAEATALFELLRGRTHRASAELYALYEATGQLRLRNLALGLHYGGKPGTP